MSAQLDRQPTPASVRRAEKRRKRRSMRSWRAPSGSMHAAIARPLACASCHMPERTDIVVDRRHDHSFRVPRPDLSARLGTPNACTTAMRTNRRNGRRPRSRPGTERTAKAGRNTPKPSIRLGPAKPMQRPCLGGRG